MAKEEKAEKVEKTAPEAAPVAAKRETTELITIEKTALDGSVRRRQCDKPDLPEFVRRGFKVAAALLIVCALVQAAIADPYTPVTRESASVAYDTATVTEAAEVTLDPGITVLTGSGEANNATNSITLEDPFVVGKEVMIVGGGGTNYIDIVDSGNCALSAGWVAGDSDTLHLIATATNQWTELGRSNN